MRHLSQSVNRHSIETVSAALENVSDGQALRSESATGFGLAGNADAAYRRSLNSLTVRFHKPWEITHRTPMTDALPAPEFHLHFEGENLLVRDHKLPASALIQSTQALQRLVYLLSRVYEQADIKQRLRVSRSDESKYAVIFGVPQDGGYDLPYHLGGPPQHLFAPQDIEAVNKLLLDVFEAVNSSDLAAFKRAIPVAYARHMVAAELKKMQPAPRMGLYVSIENDSGVKLLNGKTASDSLNRLMSDQLQTVIHPRIVTGRLDALEFQGRTLKLQLPSGKPLNCAYAEDFEPVLVDNRREWIQVRGEAVLNDDDSLRALNNISEILEVDDTPVEIEEFAVDGQVLRKKNNTSFEVHFDPYEGTYTAEGAFHLIISAETRAELEESVVNALSFLWREYVNINPSELSTDAKDLRNALLDSFGGE